VGENASNAEYEWPTFSFTSGSVKITHQHFGPQNKTTPKRTHVVVSFLLPRVNIDNCEEIPQALSIHRTKALPNLNFGNRQHQVTIGMFRHTAHGLLILPLVHQKGTMHTSPASFSVSRNFTTTNTSKRMQSFAFTPVYTPFPGQLQLPSCRFEQFMEM